MLRRIRDIAFLTAIDLSANRLFAEWGHPEFESGSYASVPIDIAMAAISNGRLLACDVFTSEQRFELVGWLIMFDRSNEDTSIGQISVHVDHMGNGYGVPLLQAAIDRCRQSNRRRWCSTRSQTSPGTVLGMNTSVLPSYPSRMGRRYARDGGGANRKRTRLSTRGHMRLQLE